MESENSIAKSAESDSRLSLTFVIPALNEEDHIGQTIDAIVAAMSAAAASRFEIIVVDNGSEDATVEVAEKRGARVLSVPGVTIGALRNTGVEHGSGKIIVFIDADVTIASDWLEALEIILSEIPDPNNFVLGSRCISGDGESWISRTWFDGGGNTGSASHVGSGHMVVPRDCFETIGGFSTSLVTGEDYEFCQRAQGTGVAIFKMPSLRAYHHGGPATLRSFIRREIWHGRGDLTDLKTVFTSKVSLATLAFVVGHLVLAAAIGSGGMTAAVVSCVWIVGLCIVGAQRRFGTRWIGAPVKSLVLFYVYFWGRAIATGHALFDRFKRAGSSAP